MTAFAFRISPTDPLLIEWRRNQRGALWLYWHRHLTPDAARASLLAIEQVGFVIEREGVMS